MGYKVCVVTGTRADYGLLKRTLMELNRQDKVQLDLVVTGSHLSEDFGGTQSEILDDGFKDFVRLSIPTEDDTKLGMAEATGTAVIEFARYFGQNRPDLLMVLGDRFEILAAAISARMLGIPIAHISGGDVTEGAVDDSIRHSITKMSSLHFPGCKQSADRIIQMGEQPGTVFDVGEPGVENCLKMDFMSREALSENLGFDIASKDYCVVTFHPVTMEDGTEIEQLNELIKALDTFKNVKFIITMANADAGGRRVNELWLEEGKKHPNWLVVQSLGVTRYLSAMKYAKAVIGNSSSGIVEAPSLHVPTVNVGDRQKGRMLSESVICCKPTREEIVRAMERAFSAEFRAITDGAVSPFGDGNTSSRIVETVMDFLENNKLKLEKGFYDLELPER